MREEDEEPTFYHYLRATLGDDEKISHVVKSLNPNFFWVAVFHSCTIPGPSQVEYVCMYVCVHYYHHHHHPGPVAGAATDTHTHTHTRTSRAPSRARRRCRNRAPLQAKEPSQQKEPY